MCSFNLKGGKKQVTLVVALKLLILMDFLNLKLQNVKSKNICKMALFCSLAKLLTVAKLLKIVDLYFSGFGGFFPVPLM